MSPRFSILASVVLLLLSSASAALEPDPGPPLWSTVDLSSQSLGPDGDELPNKYALFGLDVEALGRSLARAPMEFVKRGAPPPVIELPTPDGGLARFLFEESPILSAELSWEYPEIRSFRAQGLDDPTLTARFDLTSSEDRISSLTLIRNLFLFTCSLFIMTGPKENKDPARAG